MASRLNSRVFIIVAGSLLLLMFVCCGGPLAFVSRDSGSTAQRIKEPQPQATIFPPAPSSPGQIATEDPFTDETPHRVTSGAGSSEVPVTDPFPVVRPKPTLKHKAPELELEDRTFKEPSFREWSARSGGFRVTAKLVAVAGNQAELLKESGETIKVPLEKLSQVDGEYVKDVIRVHPKAKVITGKVLAIFDSNSFIIDDEGEQRHVRLFGILCPEITHEYYDQAKAALSDKFANRWIWFEWAETADDGHPIGIVYVDGRDINLELVAEGVAWHDTRVSADPRYGNAQFIARQKRLGLWASSNPLPPWEAPK